MVCLCVCIAGLRSVYFVFFSGTHVVIRFSSKYILFCSNYVGQHRANSAKYTYTPSLFVQISEFELKTAFRSSINGRLAVNMKTNQIFKTQSVSCHDFRDNSVDNTVNVQFAQMKQVIVHNHLNIDQDLYFLLTFSPI